MCSRLLKSENIFTSYPDSMNCSFGDEELYVNVTSVNIKLPELVQSE